MKVLRHQALRVVGFGVLIVTLCTLLFPVVVALITSLKTPGEVHETPPTWWPQSPRFSNYVEMFSALDLVSALRVTLIVSLGTSALTIAAAVPAGYALSRFQFPGRRVFLFTVLAGLTFSPVVIVVSLYHLLNSAGLINSYAALILPNTAFALPFCIWLCVAYMVTIPAELDDAAMVDGANAWQVLTRIIVPVALPGIVTIGIFSFIQSWNEFLFANTYMIDDDKKTLSVTLYSFVGYRGIEWQYLTSAIVFATVPAVILFLLVQRWLVSGLASGAVK